MGNMHILPKPLTLTNDTKAFEEALKARTQDDILKDLKNLNIPRRFFKASLSDFSPKLISKIENFIKGNESYFVFGKPGTGKTHLACALAIHHVETDISYQIYDYDNNSVKVYIPKYPRFVNIPSLLLSIRDSFRNGSSDSERNIVYNYSNYQRLIMDDLGAEKATEWSLQTLYIIINCRYQDEKQTLFTSNLSLDDLSSKFGERIVSRIADMCKVIELSGKDKRLSKA